MFVFAFVFALMFSLAESGSNIGWDLKDKTCVVTGGSKGIGEGIVHELGALGAEILTCARNEADLRKAEINWREKNKNIKVHTLIADVSTEEGRELLLKECERIFGERGISCLINNVGSNIRKRAVEYSNEDYAKIMSTNLESAFFLSLKLHPLLLKRTSGTSSIVNVGSVAGGCNIAIRSGVIYAMTKAAMVQVRITVLCSSLLISCI